MVIQLKTRFVLWLKGMVLDHSEQMVSILNKHRIINVIQRAHISITLNVSVLNRNKIPGRSRIISKKNSQQVFFCDGFIFFLVYYLLLRLILLLLELLDREVYFFDVVEDHCVLEVLEELVLLPLEMSFKQLEPRRVPEEEAVHWLSHSELVIRFYLVDVLRGVIVHHLE